MTLLNYKEIATRLRAGDEFSRWAIEEEARDEMVADFRRLYPKAPPGAGLAGANAQIAKAWELVLSEPEFPPVVGHA
jgi:hypothetical protein